MKTSPPRAFAHLALVILLAHAFTGCIAPQRPPASATPDNALITYWPQAEKRGALRLAVKDLIDMKGVVTTAGSEFLAKHSKPATRDAACLAIARRRNVAIVGKANLSEFAVRVTGMNTYFGTPLNPVNPKERLIPGGSSSGSVVAVANHWADVAFGTDTAGSVRVPAACCGVAGLKTTFGLVSLKGVFPIEPQNLDTIGPLARDVEGLVKGMDLLQEGFAGRYQAAVAAKSKPNQLKIGRLYLSGTDPKVNQAVDAALKAAGFKVVVLDPSFEAKWNQADTDAKTIAAAGAWLYDLRFGSSSEVSATTKAVFLLGRIQYPGAYQQALKRKAGWQSSLKDILKNVDFIALPTLKTLPPKVSAGGSPAAEASVAAIQNTAAVNLAGNPALALPIPANDREIPVTSLELIGRPFGEAELLNAGRMIEHRKSAR